MDSMQEIALARDWGFLCGEQEIDPEAIEKALLKSHLLRIEDALHNPVGIYAGYYSRGVYKIRERVQHNLNSHALSSTDAKMILDVSIEIANNDLKCLLPGDRIRGILGFCQTSDLVDMELHEITDIAILYTAFSRYLFMEIDITENFQWWCWFSHACHPIRGQGLPSWVPDLHHQGPECKCDPYPLIIDYGYRVSQPFQASHKQRHVVPGKQLNELLLRGKLLDEVVIAHDIMPFSKGGPVPPEFQDLPIIAEWEEKLATSIAGVLQQHQKPNQASELHQQNLTMQEYWMALLGDIIDLTGGPMPPGAYDEFRATLQEARITASKYLLPEEYVTLS
jgi:hypothetical protein